VYFSLNLVLKCILCHIPHKKFWSFSCDVQQELDESYHKKLEENKNQAEEKTAKKRAKR